MAVDHLLPTEIAAERGTATKGVNGVAALGAITGLGALAASSCCVLPLVLGGLGAGAGVFATLEALAPLRVPFLLASTLAVAAGWWLYTHRHPAACISEGTCEAPRRSWSALALLSLATVFIPAAAVWSHIEPVLLQMLRSA